jgi:OmpA-OmpF porin, OOP family
MRRLGLWAAVGAAFCGFMGAAQAQQTPGWYIGAHVGWTDVTDSSYSFTSGGVTTPFTASSGSGIGFGFSVGYEWPFGMRAEGEATLRRNDFSRFTSPLGSGSLGGSTVSMALMGNLIYDVLPHSRWTPYVGGGVGGAAFALDSLSAPAIGVPTTSDTLWNFAYQGIAGLKFAVSPRVSLDLDYHYFAIAHSTFNPAAGTQVKGQYASHNVMLGIDYHLGVPSR